MTRTMPNACRLVERHRRRRRRRSRRSRGRRGRATVAAWPAVEERRPRPRRGRGRRPRGSTSVALGRACGRRRPDAAPTSTASDDAAAASARPAPARRIAAIIPRDGPAGERLGLEDLWAEADAVVGELLGELRADAGGLEVAPEPAVLVDAHAEVEQEDVLEGDDVALHALHLGDVGDAAGAVAEAGELHDAGRGPRPSARGWPGPAGRSRPSAPGSRGGPACRGGCWRGWW